MTDKVPWETEAVERHRECQEKLHGAGEMAQTVERLPCNQDDLVWVLRTHGRKHASVVVYILNLRTEAVQTGGSQGLTGQPT